MAKILIIDDDQLVRKSLSRLFRDKGHQIFTAEALEAGKETARQQAVDIIYLDLDLPDGDGLQAIDELSTLESRPEVIVITGMGSEYAARKTMESSAWDYISKPASPQKVIKCLESALAYRKRASKSQDNIAPATLAGDQLIGSSSTMQRLLEEIGKAANSEASILIRGETGVGKELAARAVHQNSSRKNGPFVVVDCSSLAENLIESTLYGHVKGSFTGAHSDRIGLVAEANMGTLFLDEVGEIPADLQRSFLRVLQERRFRPVGSSSEQESNFRLVAATNRDLPAMVSQGEFRSDLLFRLQTVEILLPPLRQREGDVNELVAHFVDRTCDRYGLEKKTVSQELLRVTATYQWPGNVREVMNAMEAAVIQAGTDPVIYPKHLPSHIRFEFLGLEKQKSENNQEKILQQQESPPNNTTNIPSYAMHKRLSDHRYFEELLQAVDYDINTVAEISGLSVPSVYRYLNQNGIPTKRPKNPPLPFS